MHNPAFREKLPPSILRFSSLPAHHPVPHSPSPHIIVQVLVQPPQSVYRYCDLCPLLLSLPFVPKPQHAVPIPSYTCSAPQPASASLDNHQTSQPSKSRCNEELQDRWRHDLPHVRRGLNTRHEFQRNIRDTDDGRDDTRGDVVPLGTDHDAADEEVDFWVCEKGRARQPMISNVQPSRLLFCFNGFRQEGRKEGREGGREDTYRRRGR